ncbi:AsmA family protein [Psychromonas sp.]|uniref:AsmA family protein n=1 Tax=Psychromonas sp. TaxID=1884585 RepID=UPI0035614F81
MKLILKLFAGLVVIFLLAAVVLVVTIDPNDYKQQIQAQVKNTINRDLSINGDISWAFYPQLAFSSGEIELHNPDGFNRKNLLKIDQAMVGINILPLLKGQIQIGEITLNGLVLNLITNKDGSSNLDNMGNTTSKSDAKEQTVTPTTDPGKTQESVFFAPENLQLAGVNINDAQIEIQDLKAGTTNKADIKKIHLGKFSPGQETDLSMQTDAIIDAMVAELNLQSKLLVSADLTTIELKQLALSALLTGEDLPNGKINSSVNADLKYNLDSMKAELSNLLVKLDQIQLSGNLSLQTKNLTTVRFALKGNQWDLAPYLPQSEQTETAENSSGKTAGKNTQEQEPDLSILNSLDVDGTLSIEGIQASGLTIGKIDSKIIIKKGKAQLTPLTAELYQGFLNVDASLENNRGLNSYQIASNLKDVQIRPLLIDAAKIDYLSGTTAFNFAGKGQGLTATKIKTGLTGNGDFKLTDGELYGVNIPQEIRILKAKLQGKALPTEADIKKTDFALLSGNFTVKNAIVDNQKLLMLSPVIRLDGSGLADILKETLDYRLSVTPLSKSSEETAQTDLDGLSIPLLIKGSFTDPKFSLDTQGVIKEKLDAEKKRLEEKIKKESEQKIEEEKKKLEDKLKGKINKLFG